MRNSLPTLSRSSVMIIAGTAAVLAGLALLLILPLTSSIKEYEQQCDATRRAIEDQKALKPMYAKLEQRLRAGYPLTDELAGRKVDAEGTIGITAVSQQLADKARNNGLHEPSFLPDPASLSKANSGLLVSGKAQGEFNDFRAFLLDLTSAGYYRGLDTIRINRPVSVLEYSLATRLNIGKPGTMVMNATVGNDG